MRGELLAEDARDDLEGREGLGGDRTAYLGQTLGHDFVKTLYRTAASIALALVLACAAIALKTLWMNWAASGSILSAGATIFSN